MNGMPSRVEEIRGMKVTVMGLGLHGGGAASAAFFADRGAEVTVTDLRDEAALRPSIELLGSRRIRYVLGRHETADFSDADVVIKNPAVRTHSPYLAAAAAVETDISVFLRYSRSPLVAVTGSKGKSSAAAAIQHGFMKAGMESLLGGNITRSPLSFLDETAPEKPVVLELSSWQLADMRNLDLPKPRVAVITAIMPDHMNSYSSMEEYVADKRLIYAHQDAGDATICDRDSEWGRSFASETRAQVLWYSELPHGEPGGWLDPSDSPARPRGYWRNPSGSPDAAELVVPAGLAVPGRHMRKNLLAAALALKAFRIPSDAVADAMSSFPGIAHRLEFFAESAGVKWYNDSAATIPQAVSAALDSFDAPVVLITGGTDKNLDFSRMGSDYGRAAELVLLAGTGTDKLMAELREAGVGWHGPYASIGEAVEAAFSLSKPGMAVLLSPGCTSFGMFLHEFDRGDKFKEAVLGRLGRPTVSP